MFKWLHRKYRQWYRQGILDGRQQVIRSLPTLPVSIIVPDPQAPPGALLRAYNEVHPRRIPPPVRLTPITDPFPWLPDSSPLNALDDNPWRLRLESLRRSTPLPEALGPDFNCECPYQNRHMGKCTYPTCALRTDIPDLETEEMPATCTLLHPTRRPK